MIDVQVIESSPGIWHIEMVSLSLTFITINQEDNVVITVVSQEN